ncbi:adrenocorticotropic hormone receptor-like [Hydractinia symbiolongicarpus]|uniref:adrenocorticotropic hormone receptor-like n=1 Tax=Hydractinia symbiolongicarpus TaxID=13093 RepID=UPI00254B1BF2|nr:adrenocorticotropic hormone receptor-like [Hydractinia symbiolongicarpus]
MDLHADNTTSTTDMTCSSYLAGVKINLYFHSLTVAYAMAISLLTILFNSVYITSVIRFTRNYYPSDIMYILLSVSDLLSGLVYTPTWSIAWIIAIHQSRKNCFFSKVLNAIGHILAEMSFFAIVGITFDLHLFIIHPFFYDKYITNRRTFLFVIGIWMMTIVLIITCSVTSIRYWRLYETAAGVFAVILCLIISFLHIKIYLEIRRMCKKITSATQIDILNAKKKSAKTGVKILVTFILCFLPISCCVVYRNIIKRTTFVATYADQMAHCIYLLNPLLDPFVYYFRLSRIRSNISRIFNKKIGNK